MNKIAIAATLAFLGGVSLHESAFARSEEEIRFTYESGRERCMRAREQRFARFGDHEDADRILNGCMRVVEENYQSSMAQKRNRETLKAIRERDQARRRAERGK